MGHGAPTIALAVSTRTADEDRHNWLNLVVLLEIVTSRQFFLRLTNLSLSNRASEAANCPLATASKNVGYPRPSFTPSRTCRAGRVKPINKGVHTPSCGCTQ